MATQSSSPLLRIPFEILENVAFYAACSSTDGLPSNFTNLLCTCKHMYQRLRVPPKALPKHYPTLSSTNQTSWKNAEGNAGLYARILRHFFSTSAIERRGRRPTLLDCTEQLVIYCQGLRSIKQISLEAGDTIRNDDLEDLLWPIFFLLCDNEEDGVNRRRVEEAGTYNVVMRLIAQGLGNGDEWPEETTKTCLLLWIAWMLSTKARIEEEDEDYSDLIVHSILPWVLVPFRYTVSYLPPHIYDSTISYSAHTQPVSSAFVSSHGSYPVAHGRKLMSVAQHFRQDTAINLPPPALAARLLYFTRRERYKVSIPPHLPADRSEAIARARARVEELLAEGRTEEANNVPDGRSGATKEDLLDWVREDGGTLMADHKRIGDADWWRMRLMMTTHVYGGDLLASETDAPKGALRSGNVYEPGSASGLWVGRLIISSEHTLRNVLTDPSQRPRDVTEDSLGVVTVPFYMRLTEHVLYHSTNKHNRMVPCATASTPMNSENMLNAWMPPYTTARPDGNDLEVRVAGSSDMPPTRYKTWSGQLETHDEDTCPSCQWRESELRALRADFASVGLDMDEGEEILFEDRQDYEDTDGSDEDEDMEYSDNDESEAESDDEAYGHTQSPSHIPVCNGVRDILFTGGTDPQYAAAWGDYTFFGRVRPSDGLIGIVRTPARQITGGRMFMYGYIIGGENGRKNFTGNWRMAGAVEGIGRGEDRLPGWEGAFSIGLRDEHD